MNDKNKAAVKSTILDKMKQMERFGFIEEDLKEAFLEELLNNLEEKVWKD